MRVLRPVVLLALAWPTVAGAQSSSDARVTPELRADAIVARARTLLHAGAGLQVPAGYYARIGIIAGAGADVGTGATVASGRLDLVGRFLFDPFRQNRWGLSAGAGVSLRVREGDRVRPQLLTVFDLEGPRGENGLVPAVQLGLGGGVRLGAAMRWGAKGSR